MMQIHRIILLVLLFSFFAAGIIFAAIAGTFLRAKMRAKKAVTI
jgi:hypothetical protein